MATYKYNSENSEAPGQQRSNSGSSKNRIFESFKSTIDLDELSLPSNPPPSAKENEGQIETTSSLRYPLIKINDYILNEAEIVRMEIDSTDVFPTISLKVEFIHQTFLTREMPKDGDLISVAIRNKDDMLKLIRNDYVITGVQSGKNTTLAVGPVTMNFFGVLFIPGISNAKNSFSFEGTSMKALKTFAKSIQLGFATNEDDTQDKQVWINGHVFSSDFINKTVERSWRDEESFYDWWVDIYYNLNFVNVNKQLLSSEESVDPAAWLNNIDKDYTYGGDTSEAATIETPKVLSNYDIFRTTPFYIINWKPVNKASQVSYDVGTRISCNLFEHNDKVYKNDDAEKYWSIPLEPTYDPEKIDKYILLRGRTTQNPDMRGKDLARANYSMVDLNHYTPWMGIQYTISNPDEDNLQWDGNHHRNYIRARAQNVINNRELDKLNVVVTVNGVNMNLIKGDKTPIVLIKKDPVENRMVSPESAGGDLLEQFYSGWFYVKGFKIIYDKDNAGSIMSNFRQEFVLTRREWPPPVAVEALPKNENNT